MTYLNQVVEQGAASSHGGKRLRARLLIQTARTFVPRSHHDKQHRVSYHNALVDLACALEIFQTAALIHDDIIDDADSRRGAPSAHRALAAYTHHDSQGRALALMLGDLLATLSIRTAYEAAQQLPNSDKIFQSFLHMHDQVELGQIMDVSMESADLEQLSKAKESILQTYINKTASYTTTAPLYMGLLASGNGIASTDANTFAHSAGDNLGVAFQIHDDLLDLLSDPSITGKPVGGDILEGKRTLLLSRALELSTPSARAQLVDIFADERKRDTYDVQTARTIFINSGAVDACIDEVEHLWQRSARIIASTCMYAGVDDSFAQQLISLCQKFVD